MGNQGPNSDDFITTPNSDIPSLLDYFIDYTCYLLEKWGFHWWEGENHVGKTVPWIIEFQKRIIASKKNDKEILGRSSRKSFGTSRGPRDIGYRIDLKTVFNKRNFQSVNEIKSFTPRFLKHFIWGMQRHQDYFFAKIGLDVKTPQNCRCNAYLQARITDDRSLSMSLGKQHGPLGIENGISDSIMLDRFMNGVLFSSENFLRSRTETVAPSSASRQQASSNGKFKSILDDYFSSSDHLLLEKSTLVIERKENLNIIWGVGCDYSFVKIKVNPLYPLLPLKREAMIKAWKEDLEKRTFRVTGYSLWNDQVIILADDFHSLAELYLLDQRFLPFVMSILGSRCPPGQYFVGLLSESSLVIVRRNLSNGGMISAGACKTFLRRLGDFMKNGRIPTINGKCDLYLSHEGKFFSWKTDDVLASFLPSFEFIGVENLSSLDLPSSSLRVLYRYYYELGDDLEFDGCRSVFPEDDIALQNFLDERNPFSWRYFGRWFKSLSPQNPELGRLLRDFGKHLHELPILSDYFPENPLEDVRIPIFWVFTFRHAFQVGSPLDPLYVPLEELWTDIYNVPDMRKFQLALILARKLLSISFNIDYDNIVIDFHIPAILKSTVIDDEFNRMRRAFERVNPDDFDFNRSDVDVIIHRLLREQSILSPFWKKVLSRIVDSNF